MASPDHDRRRSGPMRNAADPPVRLQPLTQARVRALGSVGRDWHQRLPTLLTELADRWGLTYGRPLPGGSNSYVCRAVRTGGEPVVIKVSLPTEELPLEAAVLERADGRGYVRLLDFDPARNAVLLEHLGPSLQSSSRSVEDQLRRLADTLASAWQRPDVFPELDHRPAKATGLMELISGHYERLDRPCPQAVVDRALADAAWLAAHPSPEPVVLHGDPHPQNLMQVDRPRPGAESGYCFVDPSSFVDDRGYDLGVAIRDYSVRLLDDPRPRETLEGYAEIVSERSGVAAERVWRWAFVERVSSGLYVLSFGAERVARPFLDSAAALLR